MKEFFDKLESLFKPTHQMSAGEDIVEDCPLHGFIPAEVNPVGRLLRLEHLAGLGRRGAAVEPHRCRRVVDLALQIGRAHV